MSSSWGNGCEGDLSETFEISPDSRLRSDTDRDLGGRVRLLLRRNNPLFVSRGPRHRPEAIGAQLVRPEARQSWIAAA